MSVNDNTKPQFGFLNDKRVGELETNIASAYVKNTDLNTKVGDAGYVKSSAITSALDSYYNKTASDARYAVSADIPDISGKLDASALDSSIIALQKYATTSSVNAKLDTSALDSSIVALNKYALKSELPNMSTVATEIATKADASVVDDAISALVTLMTSLIAGSDGDLQTAYSTAKTALEALSS